ncbi:MAG: hypothetical protein JSS07_04415 [Proteobacteria bacterium]|nr:hypothetical protein [Pseudomonadota bacterium]
MRDEIKSKIKQSPTSQVDLGEMAIKDDEIEEIMLLIIQTRPNISEIFLNNNLITDIGAKILAQKLAGLSQLSVLDLQFNQIDRNGALAIFALRAHQPNLMIPFHGNKIQDVLEMEEIVKIATQK